MNATAAPISVSTPAPQSKRGRGELLRALLVAAILIAAVSILHLTPIRAYLADIHRLHNALLSLGPWVYPTSIFAVALLLACGAPRLSIHLAGGAIFGFTLGLSLTLAGAILGHYAVFLFICWGSRDWILNRFPKLTRFANAIHQQGIVGVLLARQLPAHAMIINACLALSNVKHQAFLIGTALGLIPEAIPATLVGAGLVKSSLKDSAGTLTLAAATFAILWIAAGFFLRSIRNRNSS